VLYPLLLERDFDKLPRVLREFHSTPGGSRAKGTAVVRHDCICARVLGFPPAGDNIALSLVVTAGDERETWIRNFGGTVLSTLQWQEGRFLIEAMGPVQIAFRIQADETGMRFFSERARLWKIPIPLHVSARVHGGESSWEFEVKVDYIGSYRGAMTPSL
jgi:hypothetical protein